MKNKLFNARTKATQTAAQTTYNIDLNSVIRTLLGKDEKYAKKLGEMGKQGRFVKAIEPKLRQDLIDTIEGTDVQSKLLSDVMGKVMAGTKTIESQVTTTELNDTKLQNFRLEKGYEHIEKTKLEAARHDFEMGFLQTKYSIEEGIQKEDQRLKIKAEIAKPELKQLEADERQKIARYNHYLNYGDSSRVDLLPDANYETTSAMGYVKRFISFFFT